MIRRLVIGLRGIPQPGKKKKGMEEKERKKNGRKETGEKKWKGNGRKGR